MKIAFCTCVKIGKSCIEAVHSIGGKFELFLTLHDHKSTKKSGRIYLDELASNSNTPLYKLNHINDIDVVNKLIEFEIDWLFIIGWSQIASPQLLKIPRKGIIGAHPTLLPLGRGRAAIPWAILKNLDKTGVTFFKMDEGVDTGEILDQIEIPIPNNENATSLYSKVNEAHVSLVKQIWPKLILNSVKGVKQDESRATYWEGRTPKDGELYSHMTVSEVDRLVRASTHPYPGAYIQNIDGSKIIIWSGSTTSNKDSKPFLFSDGYYYAQDIEIL
jgi:methionyl-tRNA formyltransferase